MWHHFGKQNDVPFSFLVFSLVRIFLARVFYRFEHSPTLATFGNLRATTITTRYKTWYPTVCLPSQQRNSGQPSIPCLVFHWFCLLVILPFNHGNHVSGKIFLRPHSKDILMSCPSRSWQRITLYTPPLFLTTPWNIGVLIQDPEGG